MARAIANRRNKGLDHDSPDCRGIGPSNQFQPVPRRFTNKSHAFQQAIGILVDASAATLSRLYGRRARVHISVYVTTDVM